MWSDALIKKIEFTFRSDETNSTDVLHLFNMVLREFYQEKEEAGRLETARIFLLD